MTETMKRIDWLEENLFYLDMKDHWNYNDYQTHDAWYAELQRLRRQLNEAKV